MLVLHSVFFFFNDTATTEIYTLSLHDALPISQRLGHVLPARVRTGRLEGPRQHPDDGALPADGAVGAGLGVVAGVVGLDRKSTRLNSSHANISYAVFCLKKKKKTNLVYYTYLD